MGFFDKFTGKKIDEYATEAKESGIRLIDVRTPSEFGRGHLPGALNIPLDTIATASQKLPDKDETLYVYCQSGNRSGRAVKQLTASGYTNVTNIGGFGMYRGPVEK